jgi:hypothetical protein
VLAAEVTPERLLNPDKERHFLLTLVAPVTGYQGRAGGRRNVAERHREGVE